MLRCTSALLAVVVLAGLAPAADPAGTWRLTLPGRDITFVIRLEKDGDAWKGTFLGSNARLPPGAKVDGVTVAGERVRFSIKVGTNDLPFDGVVGDKKAGGVITLGREATPVLLEPSKMKEFDRFELDRETAAGAEGPSLFDPAISVLEKATDKKIPEAEVRALVDRVTKAAEPYGPAWQRKTAERVAQALLAQEAYAALAVSQARKAERLLDAAFDDAAAETATLGVLADALKAAKQTDDLAELEARRNKLQEKEYEAYVKKGLPFATEKFEGRQGKSDRAVLVELFTGAQCPPCVAADLAFDGVEKTYKPTDVVLLQYHLHIPGPDPLTNADSEARQKFYGDDAIGGTPSILFDGKSEEIGGGGANEARARYRQYRNIIEARLEKQARAKVSVEATQKGDIISIVAKASEVDKPAERVRLRVVLAEEVVRYAGGNGMKYHHCVVRAFPGGVAGVPLKEKTGELKAEVNLNDLRKSLGKYLTDFAEENGNTFTDKPMAFKKFRVVAFVQDDREFDVFQSAQAEVEAAK